jgi:hypothetical protein
LRIGGRDPRGVLHDQMYWRDGGERAYCGRHTVRLAGPLQVGKAKTHCSSAAPRLVGERAEAGRILAGDVDVVAALGEVDAHREGSHGDGEPGTVAKPAKPRLALRPRAGRAVAMLKDREGACNP